MKAGRWFGALALGCFLIGGYGSALAQSSAAVQVQQSAWRFVDVVDGVIEVTYTVANRGQTPLENPLLVVGAPAATAVVDALPLGAMQEGGLVWAPGTLVPGDSATIRLVVTATAEGLVLPKATLRAVRSGMAITVVGRAVTLSGPELPTEWLAWAADADPTDPAIVHQAAALGGDPAAIFGFVQSKVSHQPYVGSLHGARGTLYGRAGNAVDRTNLLIALLRASGVPATMRLGTLDEAQATALYAELFPPPGWADVAGTPLTGASLKADPKKTLTMLTEADRLALGDSHAEQLAELAAMDEAALEAYVLETATPDEAALVALKSHAWAEAWLDGAWVAMDPSFATNAPGDVVGAPTSDPLLGVPEALRHHVQVRIYHEEYLPAWGQGLEEKEPTLSTDHGAGDLVGNVLRLFHRITRQSSAGFFFFSQTTNYTPEIVVQDTERMTTETLAADSFSEFISNFGGSIANSHVTGVFAQIELLAPGQVPGEGLVYTRPIADRIGFETRHGPGGTVDADFNLIAMDTVDVTSLLIQAAHPPAYVTRAQQQLLLAVSEGSKPLAEATGDAPADASLKSSDLETMRNLAATLTGTLALLHSSNLGAREVSLAAQRRQRPFNRAPRIVAARAHIPGVDEPHRIGVDLLRDKRDTVGAPGQLRSDRYAFRLAYGLAATNLEGAVMETVAGWNTLSTHQVFDAALSAGVPFDFLVGQSGINQTTDPAQLPVTLEARIRMQLALQAGKAVYGPTAPVLIDGVPRSAWYEIDLDGSMVGRLDNGMGGSLIGYAMILYKFACQSIIKCPEQPDSLYASISAFNGGLWGLIVPAIDAVSACSSGNSAICEKLATNFADVPHKAVKEAISNFFKPVDVGECTEPIKKFKKGKKWAGKLGIKCPGCDLGLEVVRGFCGFVTAYKKSQDMVFAALQDPHLPDEPMGATDPNPTPMADRYVATTILDVPATLAKGPAGGTYPFTHLRVTGALEATWSAGAGEQLAIARTLTAESASVVAPKADPPISFDPPSPLSWAGIDNAAVLSGGGTTTLAGKGRMDLYAGLLTGVTGYGTFGNPADADGVGYTLTTAGASATVDAGYSTDMSPVTAGAMTYGDEPVGPGLYGVTDDQLAFTGAFAGPLGAPSVTLTLTGGGVQLAGAEIPGSWGDATGTITVESGQATLDLIAAYGSLSIDQPFAGGTGTIQATVTLDTAIAGKYTLTATAPPGWQVAFEGSVLSITPPTGAPEGTYPIALSATGEQLTATATTTYLVIPPEIGSARVTVTADPRFSIQQRGVVTTAHQVQVTHFGTGPGTYELTASVDHPAFQAVLASNTAAMLAGATRRIGLQVRLATPETPWPAPGTAFTVTVSAKDNPAGAPPGTWSGTVGTHATALLSAEPETVILTPGESSSAQVRLLATGNTPASPALTLSDPHGLGAVLAPPGPPITPGAEGAVTLSFTAPALADAELPAEYKLFVQLPPTPFELERGLPSQVQQIKVLVTAPGTEGLIALGITAEKEGDLDLLTATLNAYGYLSLAVGECAEGDLAGLKAHLPPLIAILQKRPGGEAAAASLATQLAALETDGCDAVGGLLESVLLLEAIEPGPNLSPALQAPAPVNHGTPMALTGQIVNAGLTEAAASQATFSVRKNGAPTPIGTVFVPPLGPGETAPVSITWPTESALGHYVVSLVADATGLVAETSEADNQSDKLVQVLPKDAAPPLNAAPEWTSVPITSIGPKTPYTYTLEATDPDGDPVFFEAPVRPPGISLKDGGILSGTVAMPGIYPITVIALDAYGAPTSQSFELVVEAVTVPNAPPLITSVPTPKLVVGAAWSYPLSHVDPEGEDVTWTLPDAPSGVTLAAAALAWTPGEADIGAHFVTVACQDPGGEKDVQIFAVHVAAEAAGPDLAVLGIDTSLVVFEADGTRSGQAVVTVANRGDTATTGPFAIVAFEERDFAPGPGAIDVISGSAQVGALLPGELAKIPVEVSGEAAFEHNVLWAMVDSDETLDETDEDDNLRHSAAVDQPAVHTWVGYRPVKTASLVLVAPAVPVDYQIFDPQTLAVLDGGTLSPGVPTEVDATLVSGDPAAALPHFGIQANGLLQAYVTYEIYGPDFGGDLFHPAVDGDRVGQEFVLYVPTQTLNNRLLVMAIDDADLELATWDGTALGTAPLAAGQWWEPTGIETGGLYHLTATGRVVVQSASVTGTSVVPPTTPLGASKLGDVGTRFTFSLRSRGPGGGALAIVGWHAAEYTVTTASGQPLLAGTVAVDDIEFWANLGEQRALVLESSAPVVVLAGDMAKPGADTIGLMGEDITQQVGALGTDLLVHSQEQDVGDTVILAGPRATGVLVGDTLHALPPFGLLALEDNAIYRITATSPVLVQSQGGGDRYFDWGEVLRETPRPAAVPTVILDNVAIDTSACAAKVTASVRLGSAGSAPVPAGSLVTLVSLSTAGEATVATIPIDDELAAGHWLDLTLEGVGQASDLTQSWLVRWEPPAGSLLAPASAAGLTSALCQNQPPSFVSEPPSTLAPGTALSYAAVATDPEGEEVTYGLVDGPGGAFIDPTTGVLVWTPAPSETAATFVLSASDPEGESGIQALGVVIETGSATCPPGSDTDEDGACAPADCDDTDPTVGPASPEVPGNGVDDDCNPGTPDAVPLGSVGLLLQTDKAHYAIGEEVVVLATVANTGTLQTAAGLVVGLEITCGFDPPSPLLETSLAMAAIGPKAQVTQQATWASTGVPAGSCTANATLLAGTVALATSQADFSLKSPLAGTLVATPPTIDPGDALALDWTATTQLDVAITAELTIRHPALPAWGTPEVSLEPEAQHTGAVTPETGSLTPGQYVAELSHAGTVLAQTVFAVRAQASLTAPFASELDDLLPADVQAEQSTIAFQPLGPHPGGATTGGTVSAAWSSAELVVAVTLTDATPEDADEVRLELATVEGEPIASLTATGSEGISAVEAGGPLSAMFRLTGDVVALEPGPLKMRVLTRDGAGPKPKASWLWAVELGEDDNPENWGTLVLDEMPAPPEQDDQPGDNGDQPGDTGMPEPDEPEPPPVPEPSPDLGAIPEPPPLVGHDAGPTSDAGPEPDVTPAEDGCGCRQGGPGRPIPTGVWLVLLGLLALARLARTGREMP